FTSGAIATLAAGWVDVADPVKYVISGTEGHAAVVNGQLFVNSKKLGSDGKQPWTQLPERKPAGLDAFLDAIEGKPATLVPAREAAYRSAVMEALYAGARSSSWVKPGQP
ncbi:MAG TPA: gfo/Idh/MocA family oxidoreductase, partial [Chloroflexota bacterium]|nr:gfo/Idh/MocA family oxidoreductase [Chloroflexota bacterium]